MKLFNKFLLLAVSIAFFTTSCSSDDDAAGTTPVPLGAYENGYFVLNEGSTAETAGIDFISDSGEKTDDVFRIENPDQPEIGTFLQNIFFDATRAFIISGSTNTVTVVNRFTFEYIGTIDTNLDNPRYGVTLNGKAYVTNQSGFASGNDDFVTIIDLTDYTTTSILVGDYVDRLTIAGGKIAIANGAFGSGNAITFLNPSNNSLTSLDFGVGNSPNSIISVGNNIYTLTNSSKFIEVNSSNETIVSTEDLPVSLTSPRNLQIENNEVYFTSANSVYSFGLGDNSVSTTPLLTYETNSAFGSMYGFAVKGNKIYIGDAADFASSGTSFQYNVNGDLIETYIASGVGPNGFYFN
jgi:hypothetical protein